MIANRSSANPTEGRFPGEQSNFFSLETIFVCEIKRSDSIGGRNCKNSEREREVLAERREAGR